MHDIVIKNGTVVTATDMFGADVGIDGETVTAIAADLSGRRVIDAAGRLVIPGGIDSHCHVEQTMMGGRVKNADDFFTGTRSAGCGGTTTIICFFIQPRDGTFADIVPHYMTSAKRAAVDYSFHLQVTSATDAVLKEELPRLIADGHRSIKMFMCGHNHVDDLSIMRVLGVAREHGAFVTIHAESNPIHQYMAERLAAGRLRHPKYHALLKPAIGEREAVHRIASFSELLDTPIQIFHVSAPEAAAEIEAAQRRGARVHGETCAQYFVLSARDINRPGFEASKFVFGPAPRESANVGSLWEFFKRGVLDVVTSDHSPLNYDDPRGKKANGGDAAPELIPNGIPCVESRLSIVFSEGVVKGRISAPAFVGLTSTNAAKMFGLYPKKGTIAIGSDADIAIFDPKLTYTVRNADLNHAVDYTPFEGMQFTGKAVTTLLRGRVIFENGRYLGCAGEGRWQPRKLYDWVRPTGRFPSGYDPFRQHVSHPDLH